MARFQIAPGPVPLHHPERIVGEDEDEDRSDHHQSDLLETDVGPGGDALTPHPLDQGEEDVAAVQDRKREEMRQRVGNVDLAVRLIRETRDEE